MQLSTTALSLIHLLEWETGRSHHTTDEGEHVLVTITLRTNRLNIIEAEMHGTQDLAVGADRVLCYFGGTQEDLQAIAHRLSQFGHGSEVIGSYVHLYARELDIDETCFLDKGFLRRMFCTKKDGVFIPVMRKVTPTTWFMDDDQNLYNTRQASSCSPWVHKWGPEQTARITDGSYSNEELMAYAAARHSDNYEQMMERWSNHTLKVRLGV